MNLRRAILAAIALAAVAVGPVFSQTSAITVFAAASLKNALDDVAHAYTAATGAPVKLSYAASSAIARQIAQGAPADVFMSADADWMDELAKRGLIVIQSRHNLLTNHLALVAPVDSPLKLTIGPHMPIAAALGPDGRLAIAGPEVPAGKYAQASLERLGVWASVKDRLARGENVRATLAFVARGETPLGIVYDTDARIEPKVRIVGLFPDSSHPRIVYPAALVTGGAGGGAAFLKFVEGPNAAAIFRRYGFVPLASR